MTGRKNSDSSDKSGTGAGETSRSKKMAGYYESSSSSKQSKTHTYVITAESPASWEVKDEYFEGFQL